MPDYKLIYERPEVIRLDDNATIPASIDNRDWRQYQAWLADGNIPVPADEPSPEDLARREEIAEAAPGARSWLAANPGVISFMRLSPAEQQTAIDAMDLGQLRAVIWRLTVVVSALVRERLL